MEGESLTLTPSYPLKVTKFLVKIFQFEFLVMTEKNIFVYKLFLSINTSDLFFCKIDPVILKPHYSEHLCVSDTFFESRMKLFTWKDLNIADRTGKK